MVDLPLAAPSIAERDEFFLKVQEALRLHNLQIAPEKIQKDFPISYLGTILEQHRIRPQKLQIRRDRLKTLNDFKSYWEILIDYARYLGFLLTNYDICFLL